MRLLTVLLIEIRGDKKNNKISQKQFEKFK